MGSVDLFERPLKLLSQEARRRKMILSSLILGWLMLMGGSFATLYHLQDFQEKRHHEIKSAHEKLKPRIMQYQTLLAEHKRRSRSKCSAYRLKALFSMPVEGLSLSSLEAYELWTITGQAQTSKALDLYQEQVLQQLNHAQWEEAYQEGALSFKVKGELPC